MQADIAHSTPRELEVQEIENGRIHGFKDPVSPKHRTELKRL